MLKIFRRTSKNNFIERRDFVRGYRRNGWMEFSEPQPIDSIHNEGTNTVVLANQAEGDGLLVHK